MAPHFIDFRIRISRNARFAVIPVGRRSMFGHPHAKLSNAGSQLERGITTGESGNYFLFHKWE